MVGKSRVPYEWEVLGGCKNILKLVVVMNMIIIHSVNIVKVIKLHTLNR